MHFLYSRLMRTFFGTLNALFTNSIRFFSFSFAEKLQRAREMARSKKSACPFCKDEKKRPLNAYMRKRSQEKNTGKICEEDDEEDKCCPSSYLRQESTNSK